MITFSWTNTKLGRNPIKTQCSLKVFHSLNNPLSDMRIKSTCRWLLCVEMWCLIKEIFTQELSQLEISFSMAPGATWNGHLSPAKAQLQSPSAVLSWGGIVLFHSWCCSNPIKYKRSLGFCDFCHSGVHRDLHQNFFFFFHFANFVFAAEKSGFQVRGPRLQVT